LWLTDFIVQRKRIAVCNKYLLFDREWTDDADYERA